MRKLFQRDKKAAKDAPAPPPHAQTPQDEHWVVLSPAATPPAPAPVSASAAGSPDFSPLPPGAAPLQTGAGGGQAQAAVGTPQQSPRPGTGTGGGGRQQQHMHHPSHTTDSHHGHRVPHESVSVHSDSAAGTPKDAPREREPAAANNKLQKKGGFFSRKDREREPERAHHGQHEHHPTGQPGELTRMIGYLTGFASDDWTIVLEVCERAAANDANAKEAAKALRREFKYAEPSAQMAAARLWAIMLRYSSDIFIAQTTTKKFLDVVEDVCTSNKTTPVVRERLLEVLAGAAYAHPSAGREGFAGAWRRVKSQGQPDEGIPFDDLDPMFTPPAPKRQQQQQLQQQQQQQQPYVNERNPFEAPPARRRQRSERNTQQQVPSAEEDMRRLFEECSRASQHAQLLSQAMTWAKPSELATNNVIGEFHQKCMASQEFIVAQIDWATANAARSREKLLEQQAVAAVAAGNLNGPIAAQQQLGNNVQAPPHAETSEEQLLAALLLANEELIAAFRQYDELDRLGMQEAEEREVEARSRVETKIDRTQIQYWSADGSFQLDAPQQGHSGGPSRSPSPSSFNPSSHHNHSSSNLGGARPALPHSNSFSSSQGYGGPQIHAQPPTPVDKAMPPPPPAPMGPRRPRSRTPSPTRGAEREREREREREHNNVDGRKRASVQSLMASETDFPPRPSDKALGKRRAIEPEYDTHEAYRQQAAGDTTEESEEESTGRPKWARAPVSFVYDAAAERSKERLAQQALAKAAGVTKAAPGAVPLTKSASTASATKAKAPLPAPGATPAPAPPPASTRPQPKVAPVQTADKLRDAGGKGSLRGSPLDKDAKRPPAPARSPSQTTPTNKALPRPVAPTVNGTPRP